jgi:hypothetical protein
VSGNPNGVNGACSGGTDNTAYSLNMTTTTSQVLALGVVGIRYRTHTPGSGYTERAELAYGSGSSTAGIALVERSVPTVSSLLLNGSFDGNVDWAVIGVELRPGAAGPADIDVTPTTHDYGNVAIGANALRTFAIRNLGGTNLQVTSAAATGGQQSDFAITQGAAPFTVAPGATHNLEVRFTPAATGLRTTTLRLTSDDADENQVDVALSGTGITAAPEVVVTPASYDYGTQQVGVPVTQTFTISNTGTANLVVGASSISGPDAAAFVITSGQAGFTITPNTSNTIQVRFTAPTTGLKTATLTIPTNDADEPQVAVGLTGTGSTASATPTFEEVQHGGSAGLTTVTTAVPLLGVNGHLYLAAVSSKSYLPVTTVTGLGLTWSRVTTQCAGRNQTGIDLWWAMGTASTGTVTATYATAPNSALIVVSRYSGVASTNPVALAVAGNTNGVSGGCSNGTDSGAYSFNVTTTQSNSMIVGAAAIRSKTHTPGSGYTERDESVQGSSGDTVTIAISDRLVPSVTSLPLNGTLSGAVDWAVIGVQLRPGP